MSDAALVRPSRFEEAVLRLARSAPLSLAALVLAAAPTFFWRIGAVEVSDIVEERVAVTAREMWRSGDWIVPRMNGEVRLQKPPLAYWLPAMGASIRGQFDDFTLHLPFALAALACVLFTWGAGRILFGPETGLIAGLVLVSTSLLVRGGHTASADILLATCIAAVWLFHVRARSPDRRRGDSVLLWLCLGLGFLAKGPIVLVFTLLPMLVESAISRSRAPLRPLASVPGVLLFLLVALPWFGAVWLSARTGELPPLRQWFLETVGKMTHSDGIEDGYRYLKHPEPWHFYLARLPAMFTFWLPFLLLGLAGFAKRLLARHSPALSASGVTAAPPRAAPGAFPEAAPMFWFAEAAPLSWFLTALVFMSAISEKKISYMLPLLPAGALISAAAIERHHGSLRSILRGAFTLTGIAAGVFIFLAAAVAIRPEAIDLLPWPQSGAKEARALLESRAGDLAAMAAVLLLGCVAARALSGCSRPLPWVLALAASVSIAMVPYRSMSIEAKRGEWVGEDSRELGRIIPKDAPVLAVGRLPAGTLYYLDRRLTPVEPEERARMEEGTRLLISGRTLREMAQASAPMDAAEAIARLFPGYALERTINPAARSDRERVYYLERVRPSSAGKSLREPTLQK